MSSRHTLGPNAYRHISGEGSSSPQVVLAYSHESEPPSYSHITSIAPILPTGPNPGIYVFKLCVTSDHRACTRADHWWSIHLASLGNVNEITCTPFSISRARKVYARYRLPENLRAIIEPRQARTEPELEITQEGVQNIDSYLTSLVMMLTERPEWFTTWAKEMRKTWMRS
ncbi:hypothetical protein DL96DRAFT_1589632 [Flagelloscypha sp. PMI_526]|nr:hypothetical protein DL96DRAFT_1589632 [Flagelloscypha sp. PMI_526]